MDEVIGLRHMLIVLCGDEEEKEEIKRRERNSKKEEMKNKIKIEREGKVEKERV